MEERALDVESKALDGVWALREEGIARRIRGWHLGHGRRRWCPPPSQPRLQKEQDAGHRADFTSSPAACSSLLSSAC